MFKIEPMQGNALDVLYCLFFHGPTEDGNVPSKTGRTWLVEKEYAARGQGYNWLTTSGVLLALELGLDRKKEKWQRDRARQGG